MSREKTHRAPTRAIAEEVSRQTKDVPPALAEPGTINHMSSELHSGLGELETAVARLEGRLDLGPAPKKEEGIQASSGRCGLGSAIEHAGGRVGSLIQRVNRAADAI